MSGRSFLDTNVLVYLFDADAPDKKAKAERLLRDLREGGDAVISTQVLGEFYVTVTRKLGAPLPTERAEQVVSDLAALPVVPVDTGMVLAAIGTSRSDMLSFWDALVVEAARAAGCRRLLSEDMQHGRRHGDLVVENPFREPDPGGGASGAAHAPGA